MSAERLLAASEVDAWCARHPGWTPREGRLRRVFDFPDFVAAFGFMARVAVLAERHGHHPDWSNSYGRVVVELRTHDAGGLTARDLRLGEDIDALPRA